MLPVYLGPGLAFFDAFLKGEGDAADIPVAEWYLGHEEWRRSTTWPPPGARELRLVSRRCRSAPPPALRAARS